MAIMGHTPVYSCLYSIPTKIVMFVMLCVPSVHRLLYYELSSNYLRSIIISFLWLLPILTLNVILTTSDQ